MKKIFIITISLIFAAFILITFIKYQPQKNALVEGNQPETVDKEKIRLFWKTYRKANELRIAGQLDSAASGYKNALLYDENHEDALYYLANVYLDLNEFDKAEEYWKKLIKINPGNLRGYFQLGNLHLNYAEGNYFDVNKASDYFQQALFINKEESGTIYRVAQIELIRGNYSKARQIFSALAGSNTRNLKALFFTYYIDWKVGNPDWAISQMMNAIHSVNNQDTITGFSGEGDTKLGKPLYSSTKANRKSLFDDYVHDLAELTESVNPLYFEERFKNLDKYLIRLRKKINE